MAVIIAIPYHYGYQDLNIYPFIHSFSLLLENDNLGIKQTLKCMERENINKGITAGIKKETLRSPSILNLSLVDRFTRLEQLQL